MTLSLPHFESWTMDLAGYRKDGEHLLSHISQYITLLPGDVIALGAAGPEIRCSGAQTAGGIHGSLQIDDVGTVDFSFIRPEPKEKQKIGIDFVPATRKAACKWSVKPFTGR